MSYFKPFQSAFCAGISRALALALVCSLAGLITPVCSFAQQISPNPNPFGNTISVDSTTASNALTPFDNFGVLQIIGGGTLITHKSEI